METIATVPRWTFKDTHFESLTFDAISLKDWSLTGNTRPPGLRAQDAHGCNLDTRTFSSSCLR
jgi:hypothetical protein